MKATKASQLTAIFDSAVPADVSVEVKKGDVKIDGTHAVDGSTVTFDATANFPTGTYTFTATQGDVTKTAEVEVKAEYVAEIVLKGSEALTSSVESASGAAIYQAYIYYDVLNQYGDSIRTTTSITWTTSAEYVDYDKSLGRITVSNGSTPFTYGSLIYVTGVHTSSGTILNTSIPVGMEQAVDSIEFAGFLNKNDKTKKEENLPTDFAKNTYYLLYQTFDQNGNPLDVSDSKYTYDNLTFMADNPLLLAIGESHEVFTVDGVEYAAISVEPGQYVDKGGEVTITAMSNKTGTKKVQNYRIGSAGVLKSLVLSSPATTVADGDSGVKIPYTALDMDGNSVTNYETIVRSTNTLTLSASGGTTLVVKEEDDGTAGIYWSDSSEYNPTNDTTYKDKNSDITNGASRNISLTNVVVGGESNNLMLEVSDMRIPTAIKDVQLGPDYNGMLAVGNTGYIGMGSDWGQITFLDQYGAQLDTGKAFAFFKNAASNLFGKSSEAGYYGIKVDVTGTSHLSLNDKVYYYNNPNCFDISLTGTGDDVSNDTVKFSIAKTTNSNLASVAEDMTAWNDVSKVKSVVYTVVPVASLKNFAISGLDSRLEIQTDLSDAKNGESKKNVAGSGVNTEDEAAGSTLTVMDDINSGYNKFTVQGIYNGKTVTLPATAYDAASGSAFTVANDGYNTSVTAVSSGALLWSDLYDFNTYASPRKDAKIDLVLTVNVRDGEPVTKAVTVSDEIAKPASIGFNPAFTTLNPTLTDLTQWSYWGAYAYDQYGRQIADPYNSGYLGVTYEYTISDIVENTDSLAHVPNSFVVNQNGTVNANIEGTEIGDTFKLTVKIAGTNITNSVTLKVGADNQAYIDQDGNGTKEATGSATKDVGLRELLGYDR